MNNEKQKILDMLEKGTITPADAAKLLECLGESQREETALVRQSAQRMKGKKLRVQVEGSTEESEDLHVNVSVPLVLARYADNFLSTCLPASAAEGMKAQGIDLRQLNLGGHCGCVRGAGGGHCQRAGEGRPQRPSGAGLCGVTPRWCCCPSGWGSASGCGCLWACGL